MRSATAVELSPTAASWSRMSASRSSSAFPTGPKMVLSRITMSSRNSVAMMGRVRLKSKILPGSPAKEGATRSALVTAASTAGFTALGSSTLLLVRENGSNAKRLVSESHGHVGQCERACGAWGHEILQKNPRFKRYTHRPDRSFRNGGVPLSAPSMRARCGKVAKRREQLDFRDGDVPELGHGGDDGGASAHGLARGRDLRAREEAALDSRDSRHRC